MFVASGGASRATTFIRADWPCLPGFDLTQGGSLAMRELTAGGNARVAFEVGVGGRLESRRWTTRPGSAITSGTASPS